jgi:predicted ABC-type ATPase
LPTPVLHLIVGPNGAGKTTLFERVIGPATGIEFVNADRIAAERWPGAEAESSYEAAKLAAERRDRLISVRGSFAAETVFSHPSKLELLERAAAANYRTYLHVVLVSKELAVARVAKRVEYGGHFVPPDKIEQRFERIWPLVAAAVPLADEATVYDNARGTFEVLARYAKGSRTQVAEWPVWTPAELRGAGT